MRDSTVVAAHFARLGPCRPIPAAALQSDEPADYKACSRCFLPQFNPLFTARSRLVGLFAAAI